KVTSPVGKDSGAVPMPLWRAEVGGQCPTKTRILEGHRLKQEGIDVVVGLLETHARTKMIRCFSCSPLSFEITPV
ncbi:MAG: hypothetical protein ACLQDI_00905, partial [Syntrophobacteraceae bacterium]